MGRENVVRVVLTKEQYEKFAKGIESLDFGGVVQQHTFTGSGNPECFDIHVAEASDTVARVLRVLGFNAVVAPEWPRD